MNKLFSNLTFYGAVLASEFGDAMKKAVSAAKQRLPNCNLCIKHLSTVKMTLKNSCLKLLFFLIININTPSLEHLDQILTGNTKDQPNDTYQFHP